MGKFSKVVFARRKVNFNTYILNLVDWDDPGIMKTIGETTVALNTLVRNSMVSFYENINDVQSQVIALNTFFIVFWRPFIHPIAVIAGLWLFVILFAVISSVTHNNPSNMFIVPTPVSTILSL